MIRVNHCGPKTRKQYRRYAQPPVNKFFNDIFNSSVSDVVDKEFVYSRPSVNIIEADQAYTIDFAIPGIAKEDIKIHFEKGILKVEAGIPETEKESPYKTLKREFDYSTFKRTFKLPDDVDEDKISANMKNGVLSISIEKKREEDLRKTIHVS